MTLEQLRRSPLLAGLPDDVLAHVREATDEITLEAGEVLLREGEAADALYVVLDGDLEVSKHLDRSDVSLAVCGPGEVLGELSLLHGRPRSATVRASTPARLLRVRPETLEELLTEPSVLRPLLATVAHRLEQIELQVRHQDRMATLGTLTAGLLHEVNNPAAAVRRGAAQLADAVSGLDEAAPQALPDDVRRELAGVLDAATPPGSGVDRLDAEERLEKLFETQRLREPAAAASALAALGPDAGELETVLARLEPGQSEAAVRWLESRGRVASVVRDLSLAATRLSEVVDAVKRYSHVDEAPEQDVDVHEGIEAALTLLKGRIPAGVTVERDYDPDLPSIVGCPGDLNTVWTNLLDNALHAAGGHGTVSVATARRADGVEVTVANTGPEVPPEVLDRVFDPFFTTKPVGVGTGMGLATVQTVVAQRHRGRIAMTSGPDRTRVTVWLPRRGAEAADRADHSGPGGS